MTAKPSPRIGTPSRPQNKPSGAKVSSESTSPLSDQLTRKVRGQPALAGAMTISRKAAKAGFEWDDMKGVWDKVHEELDELKEAVSSGDPKHAQEELGDLLFTLVNVARWCDIQPEEGLAGTNQRFLDRFSRVEAALGGDLQDAASRNWKRLWQQAKAGNPCRTSLQAPAPNNHPDSWANSPSFNRPMTDAVDDFF